ncbi:MAG: hypothetical protein GXP26_08930 [Planctomycetes bacterium]|nr:hypothetical protein [Planctomycetota bacterium]
MFYRLLMLSLICLGSFAWQAPAAEAGWRNGRRATRGRTYSSRSTRSRTRSTSRSKPYMTQSRSAVLDGFFGPGPGMQGNDRSWYVGK